MSLITVVGIDPGATAGLVCLRVDPDAAHDLARWTWVDSLVLRVPSRKGLTDAECRIMRSETARAWIGSYATDIVVIERPADALRSWNAQGQGGQRTGTAFALGEAYGMLAYAAHAAGARRIFEYAVTAWMPKVRSGARGQLKHTQKREDTLAQLGRLMLSIAPAPDIKAQPSRGEKADENVLMALGVLHFHLTRGAQ